MGKEEELNEALKLRNRVLADFGKGSTTLYACDISTIQKLMIEENLWEGSTYSVDVRNVKISPEEISSEVTVIWGSIKFRADIALASREGQLGIKKIKPKVNLLLKPLVTEALKQIEDVDINASLIHMLGIDPQENKLEIENHEGEVHARLLKIGPQSRK